MAGDRHGPMDLRADMSVGDRVRVARRFQNLSQEQLAERAGVHVDTIRKLEQGQRQTARVSTLGALARALDVPTIALLEGVPEWTREQNPGLLAVRRALVPASDFMPGVRSDPEDAPPDLDVLRDAVADAWSDYHSGDLESVGTVLPHLLAEARVAVREHTNGSRAVAAGILTKALQVGAHTLVQNHMEDMALLGLERARAAAEESGDPMLAAMVGNSVSWIFMRTGRLDDSRRVALAAADAIEPSFRRSPATQVAAYGGLLLSAVTAAARDGRYDSARELLMVARAAGERVGDSTDRFTSVFGPTAVAMQAVGVETAAGEWGRALEAASRVPAAGVVPASWTVRFLLDVAHAQVQTYRDAAAMDTLRRVRRLAPAWMRRHGLARAVVRDLLRRPTRPRGVVAMAEFLGVETP